MISLCPVLPYAGGSFQSRLCVALLGVDFINRDAVLRWSFIEVIYNMSPQTPFTDNECAQAALLQ